MDKAASTQPGTGAPSSVGKTKIDNTLKSRHKLLRSFTLEEANIWFDGFTTYFNHNLKVLENLPPSVRRQILNYSFETGLANGLQADDEITADTPIIGDNECLSRLKRIFLEKNLLFLRRHQYQQCCQTQGEMDMEWWVQKKAKERECNSTKSRWRKFDYLNSFAESEIPNSRRSSSNNKTKGTLVHNAA